MTVTRTQRPGASEPAPPAGSATAGTPAADLHAADPEAPAAAPRRTPIEIVVLSLVAVAIGVAFRFIARTPLWLDEALSVNIAQLPPAEINQALRQDGHPPLYYYLLHYWMQVFGTSDIAVRALSGVISVATLPLAWLAGRRRGGPLMGWVVVAVLSVSTFAVRYATETRMYALLILLVFAGYLVLDDVVRQKRAAWWRLVMLGAISGLLLLTHYWSMYFLASVGLVLLWKYWRARDHDVRNALLAMVTGAVLLFLPWLGVFRFQSAHTGTPWATPTRPTAALAQALQDLHTSTSDFKDPVLTIAATALLIGLGLFGVAIATDKIELDLRTVRQIRAEAIVLGLTLGLGVAAGLLTRSAFASRYIAVIFPLFVLVVAAGVTRFVSRPGRFGVLAAYLALSMIGTVQLALVFQRSQAREIANAVAASNPRPGDVVVYCPDQLGPAGQREMARTYPGDLTQVSYPSLDDPGRVNWVDYAQRNQSSDPKAVADRVLAMAGDSNAIYVVWASAYKTYDDKCEQFMHQLLLARPGVEDLVTGDTEKFYEFSNLKLFRPNSPPP
ncbi:MAG: glycosyltransferase family 39 protein [Actinobacteria bacterium]|nr:glycosyltransferase family 39 protein [Actinomycetota bacterium]